MITKEEIEKLANLARIKLNPEEKESLINDVGAILSYVDEINLKQMALVTGVYLIRLNLDGKTKTERQVVVH